MLRYARRNAARNAASRQLPPVLLAAITHGRSRRRPAQASGHRDRLKDDLRGPARPLLLYDASVDGTAVANRIEHGLRLVDSKDRPDAGFERVGCGGLHDHSMDLEKVSEMIPRAVRKTRGDVQGVASRRSPLLRRGPKDILPLNRRQLPGNGRRALSA
jgi:hypothetical protein